MDLLAQVAPHVTVSTVRNTAVNLRDEMEAGHVDLAAGLLPQLKSGFFQRRLFRQRYVCMFREGHALDKPKVTLKQFAQAEHVVVVAAGTGHAKVDETIARMGTVRNVKLTVPHFVAVGHILATTEMIATIAERYARECVQPFRLKYVTHPVALPDIGINVFWHAKYHKDPGNQWLRGGDLRRVFRLRPRCEHAVEVPSSPPPSTATPPQAARGALACAALRVGGRHVDRNVHALCFAAPTSNVGAEPSDGLPCGFGMWR
jgi:DNA-binding transcriptional LysR family regulator